MIDQLIWEKQEVMRLLKGAPGTQYQEADEPTQELFRNWIRSLLNTNSATVTFVKADGTVRDMRCTLDHDKIPVQPAKPAPAVTGPVDGIVRESKKPRKAPDVHSLRVYDLEKQEWRSFRFDRLKKVTAEINFE